MTRSLLVAVIALGLAAGLGILMVRDPGYLGVAYGGWLFESSLWLGLLGLALLAFVLRTLTLSVARIFSPQKTSFSAFGFCVSFSMKWMTSRQRSSFSIS